LNKKLMPDPVMRVILSGLLNSTWGFFHRSTVVRLVVYDDRVEIGVAEGNMYQWEIDVLRNTIIKHSWIRIKPPSLTYVSGTKYVPEKKTFGMPRGLIPVQGQMIPIFVSHEIQMIFPAYKCFDINFGEQRILSIAGPKTLVKDVVEAIHPVFSKEKYLERIHNVEVEAKELSRFFKSGYGIGILRKTGLSGRKFEAFPLLGETDIMVLVENLNVQG